MLVASVGVASGSELFSLFWNFADLGTPRNLSHLSKAQIEQAASFAITDEDEQRGSSFTSRGESETTRKFPWGDGAASVTVDAMISATAVTSLEEISA